MSRRELVTLLLETYREAVDPAGRNELGDGPRPAFGSRPLTVSALYRAGSYQELERCLLLMRSAGDVNRRCYWHVSERYLRSHRRTCWTCPACQRVVDKGEWHKHKDAGRWRRFDAVWASVESWHPMVNRQLVDEGVRWLAANMRRVEVPLEILEVMAA